MGNKIILDPDVAACTTYTRSGSVSVDLFKLAQTPNGKKQLNKLLEELENADKSI